MEESNLSRLEQDLIMKADVCSSWGAIGRFPAQLTRPFHTYGVGLIVCDQGEFRFSLDSRNYSAHAGETVFLPADVLFQIQDSSDDLVAYVLIYKVEPIRDIVGNVAQSLRLYSNLSPDKYYVWQTGEEKNVVRYMQLLEKSPETQEEPFNFYERKLLLLSLTYRLCSIFHRKLMAGGSVGARRTEIFLRLIQLIDQFYMSERGVEFYADKLCLSPKYLSGLSKSICGYTVQELVFKEIVRKSMSLLNGTSKTVLEISEELNFPSASSFGTFFKKQTGLSPQKYRENRQ